MEAAIAVISIACIPFSGIFFRRYLNTNHDHHPTYNNDDHDQSQCHIPSRLVQYLAHGIGHERWFLDGFAGRLVLQITMVALHTTNALLLFFLLKKILGRRGIHDEHICICSYVAVASIFAAHNSRIALLNDMDGDLSLLFLIAVVMGLSGLVLTISRSNGANVHFQPSIIATMLLVAGIILVFVILFFGEDGLMSLLLLYPSSSSPRIDSSSSSHSFNNARYYMHRVAQATPLPASQSMLSLSPLIASTQHSLWAVVGMISKGIVAIRYTLPSPPTAMRILKMLQSVLNIIKAQLYLPVNVDVGYVQAQWEAIGLLFSRSQSLGLCRSGSSNSGTGGSSTDESKVVSTLHCAASAISRLSTDYAPVMELAIVIALAVSVIVRCTQQQLRRIRRHSKTSLVRHINPFGITSIVLVSLLCCLNDCFSSNSGSNNSSRANISKDSEMLVLSRQSYIPSAFMSVCLGELMVVLSVLHSLCSSMCPLPHSSSLSVCCNLHVAYSMCAAAVALADAWAAQLLVSKDTAAAAGGGGIGNDSLLLTGVRGQTPATLVQSLMRIVLRLSPGRTPLGDPSPRPPPTLTAAAVVALDKSATKGYWLVKALQLLALSMLTMAADTLYKSFHPNEPRCFFRTTATREMEFFCCPTI